MLSFQDLIDETFALVQDNSFDDITPSYINEALIQLVTEAQLPELKRVDVVTTSIGSPYVSIAGGTVNGIGKVIRILVPVNSKAKKYDSMEAMYEELLPSHNTTDVYMLGDEVEGYAVEGDNFWYFPLPTVAQSFTVMYIANPPVLVSPGDSVTLKIPDAILRKAVCHGAAEKCWNKIEDGIDGDKVNTMFHEKKKLEGILELKTHKGRSREHKISSVWRV